MSCYHPLKGFVIPSKLSDKGYEIKVQGFDVKCMVQRNGKWYPGPDNPLLGERVVHEYIQIPCGKCYGCRLDYSRQWADRCLMELEDHKCAYFLTLTYDDEHLPYPDREYIDCDGVELPFTYLDPDTGECGELPTLRKRDIQLFHKRLRERTGQKIRYFTAGEYGDYTQRPHYHSIEFGLEIPDLELYSIRDGYNLYTSDFINEVWQNGHVIIGNVTWETCAYTARYVMKKLNGKLGEYYEQHNIDPEFVLMSRKPGIGRSYYEKNGKELYLYRSIPIASETGGVMVRSTNRYFDRLTDAVDPEFMTQIKRKRIEAAKHTEFLKNTQTSLMMLDRLLAEEENKISVTKSLVRVDN